jgi:hypothetical protein
MDQSLLADITWRWPGEWKREIGGMNKSTTRPFRKPFHQQINELTSWDFHRLVWSQPGVAVRVLTSTTTRLLEQARVSTSHAARIGETP